MKRSCLFIYLLFFSVLCFAQQNAGIRVIGRIPDAVDNKLYQMQVGSFKVTQNATNAFNKLRAASLNPSYEKYQDLTRVIIKGVSAFDIPAYIERIRKAGFSEVFIKIDPAGVAAVQPPPASQQPQANRTPPAVQQPPANKPPPAAGPPQDSYIPESEPDMTWQNNGTGNDFPAAGLWKLSGHDAEDAEWKADIVINNVRNNNFDGYFDWYMGPDLDYSGKEYFTGWFDTDIDKIYFQGTRLENSKNLVLGKYEAYVSIDRKTFYNGRWEEPDDIPASDWQATRE